MFSAFTVLVCTSEIFAQPPGEPDVIKLKIPGKSSDKDDSSDSEDATKDEDAEEQREYQDPPRELITQEELDAFKAKRGDSDFKRAMRAGKRSPTSDKIIRDGIRVWVYRMTLKEHQRNVRSEMDKLLRQIRGAANAVKRLQPKRQFRAYVCQETVARSKELLDNNNEVRLNATILISELNVIEPKSGNNPPAESYSPSTVVLLEIIQDGKQPVPVKIQAARGITRNALLGVPFLKTAHKNDLIQTIVKELQNAKKLSRDQAGPWYQARLLETLAAIDLPLTVQGDPLIFKTLESFLDDPKLELSVRCMAARSLGRAKLPNHPQIDSQRLSLKLAKLGLDLTNGYNGDYNEFRKNSGKKNMRLSQSFYRKWQKHFWDLYLAFHPENDYDKMLYRNRKLGLNAKYPNRKEIRDAYQKILPLAAHVLKQPEEINRGRFIIPLPQNQIQALSDWIKNHPQAADTSSVPDSTPVSSENAR